MTPRRRVILLSPEPPPRATLQALDRRGIDVLTVAAVDACVDQLRFSAWHLCVVGTSDADAVRVRHVVRTEELGVAVVPARPRGWGRRSQSIDELVVRALGALPTQPGRGTPLTFRELRINPACYEVEYEDRSLELNRRQFRLLYLLALHAPEPVHRAELAAQLNRAEGAQALRNVDALVCRLRAKLLAATGRTFVLTVQGVGYRLDAEGSRVSFDSPPDIDRRPEDDFPGSATNRCEPPSGAALHLLTGPSPHGAPAEPHHPAP